MIQIGATARGELERIVVDGVNFLHDASFAYDKREFVANPCGPTLGNYVIEHEDEEGKVLVFNNDQHGLSRYLDFRMYNHDDSFIYLEQFYQGELVRNPKHVSGKERPSSLNWFPYILQKSFTKKKDGLNVRFDLENLSQKSSMLSRLAWHPVFRVYGSPENVFVNSRAGRMSLKQISDRDGSAIILKDNSWVSIYDMDNNRGLLSEGAVNFPHTIVWVPKIEGEHDWSIVAVEPAESVDFESFNTIGPGLSKSYEVNLKFFVLR